MWNTISVFVVGFVVIYIVDLIRKLRNLKWKNVPPGSMGLPFIGETLYLLTPSYSLDDHPFIKTRFQRYGPIFRTSMLGRPVVVSSDVEFNNNILRQEGKSVEFWYLDTLSQVIGINKAISGEQKMNSAGDLHNYFRSTLLKRVGVESLKENLISKMEQFVVNTLCEWSSSQSSIDVKIASSTMILNFSAKILISSYDATNSVINLRKEYATVVAGAVGFPFNFPGTAYYKCLKAKDNVIGMLKDELKKRRILNGMDENGDIIDQFVNDLNKDKSLSEDILVHLIFASLLAASEASSATVTLLLKLLSDHPLVVQELTAEHEELVKRRGNQSSSLSWDEYKSMTFTHQVINEALRLQNGSPGLLRRAVRDIQIKGFTIPAGWNIMLVTSKHHLSPNKFPNPLEFNPWRWKDIDSYERAKNFMPFGRGIRQCPGADYTRALMATFLHVLLTKHRWSKANEGVIVRKPLLGFGKGIYMNFFHK